MAKRITAFVREPIYERVVKEQGADQRVSVSDTVATLVEEALDIRDKKGRKP